MTDEEESAYEAIQYIHEEWAEYYTPIEIGGYDKVFEEVMNKRVEATLAFERDRIALANMRKTWDELS